MWLGPPSTNTMPVEGFDEFSNELDQLQQNARELDGSNDVPLLELFNPTFMQKYTDFETFEQMIEESRWTVETQHDFEQIPERQFDMYVRERTQFSDSDEMMKVAGEEWLASELGLQ